ncbi:MAG: signal peptidase I [Lachnospiraceae bacterium]|nr:signal peptidase I [Lachnospiraceae bacterium]
MKKALQWIGNIVFVLLLVALCYIIYSVNKYQTVSIFGHHLLRVLSTSMEPEIVHNECIVVEEVPANEIKVGDIITFVSEEPEIYGYFNTHRVYDMYKNSQTGEMMFITKGDAYSTPDDLPVPYENVLGKYTDKLPGGLTLGNIIHKLSDSKIYFIVIILPLLFCLLSYLYQLIRILIFGAEDEEEESEEEIQQDSKDENVQG